MPTPLENSPCNRKRLDPVEAGGVVPQDFAPRRLRQGGIVGEVAHGVLGKLLRGIGMRIVGGHDEVVVADVLYEAADQLLAGFAADDALPLPVGARQLFRSALPAQGVVLPVFVHPLQPIRQPAAARFELGDLKLGESLQHSVCGQGQGSQHLLQRVARDVSSERAVAVRPGLGHNRSRPFVHANRHLQLRGNRIDRKVVGMAERSPLEPVRAPEDARET